MEFCDDLYLDILCSILLFIYNKKCCCKDSVRVFKEENKNVFKTRITLGFICNVASLILICVLNRETFVKETTALGLFVTIILFISLSYIIVVVTIYFVLTEITEAGIFHFMILYRIYEIELDLLLFFYGIVVSNWELTPFASITTALASVDIALNLIILVLNIIKSEHREGNLICIFVVLPIFFPVIMPIILMCKIVIRKDT